MSLTRPRRVAGTAIAVTAALALSTLALTPAAAQTAPTTVELQVLGINDFHGHLDPGRTAADPSVAGILGGAVKQYRAANPNTVFASAGDNIGASPFISSSQQDEPTIDALNAMGLAVSAVGNHEFDRGYADLAGRVEARANYSILGANVSGESPELKEYDVVRTPSGVTIGFVGVVTQETGTLVAPSGIAGITFTDPVAAASRVADQLSDGSTANGEADVVVLLAHEGAARSAATVTDCATLAGTDDAFGKIVKNTSANVDAIIGGHTHLVVDCEIAGPGGKLRPVLEASEYGKALDRLTMTYDTTTKQVTAASGEVVPLTATAFTTDPDIERIVQAAKVKADEIGREVIGSVTTDIPRAKTSSGAEDRGEESLLGNFIADVQLDAVNDASQPGGPAQIAFMNPGGLRADILRASQNAAEQPGEVTFAEVAVVQPFANTLFTLTLTGAQVKQVLEEQYQPDGGSRPFLALGVSKGFRYELDGTKARGQRISNITLNGTALSPTATYRVVTNSFLASGGDNFRTLGTGTDRRDTGLDDLSVLVAHFRANSPVTPDTADRSVVINRLPAPAPSASPSATPTATITPRPSATPTVTMTPSPSPSCATTPTVELDRATIIATGSAQVTVRGPANTRIELLAYTRPSTTYTKVRDAVLGTDGTTTFRVVPPANTRLYAQVVGCDTDEVRFSKVLNVRTALSLAVERNGVRSYTFSGDSLPARAGGLLISLYRTTDDGRQVLTSQTRADARNGEWTINRTFTGTGRFGFLVRTGQDLQNAPGTSNVRSTLIF